MEINRAIIQLAINGDEKALASIVSELQDPIFGLAYRMMLNIEDAKDASQEALIRIVTRLSSFKHQSKFLTWAWRVAFNCIIDYKSTAYDKARIPAEYFISDLSQELDMKATEKPEDAIIISQIKMGCASAVLNTLDGKHRASLILVDVMEFPTADAAEILNINAAALRKQVSRARTKVREVLDHCGIVNEEAPCRCYRKMTYAKKMKRVPNLLIKKTINIKSASKMVQKMDYFAQTAKFYQNDPALLSELKIELHHLDQLRDG